MPASIPTVTSSHELNNPKTILNIVLVSTVHFHLIILQDIPPPEMRMLL